MNGKMEGEYNGTLYRICFEYEAEGRITTARVEMALAEPKSWVTLRLGFANLHPKDRHCRETGRKVALADAVFGEDREFRTFIWGVYHGRKVKK